MISGLEWLTIGVMLFINAIFAAYEMALASISRSRIAVLVGRKDKGAEDAAYMKDRIEASLAVVQVGITLAGAIAAATGGSSVADNLEPYLQAQFGFDETLAKVIALVILIIPFSALTIIFAELIPKMVALNNRERICLSLSPAMRAISVVFYPVITVLETIVKGTLHLGKKSGYVKDESKDDPGLHELNAAVSLARASRLIGAREEKIVLSAAQLSVRPVKSIMLPIADVSMIPLKSTLSEALIRAHLDMHTRFPVCEREGDPQSIQGYLNFKDIMMALKLNSQDPTVKGIIRPIKTVEGNVPIAQVLEKMMQEKLHIALVGEKDQSIIGMVTMEDIIEELVGEIEDEFDRMPTYIHPFAGGWIVGGGVSMQVLAQTIGITPILKPATEGPFRLADWCALKHPDSLRGGEVLEGNGFYVTVRKLRRKKLSEASISLLKPQ
ncbi:MAG: HlyC/CorC family transporter [Candidatus Omnitrophica bacterium]|nr:HlyC/CorC family transporter [Candidatus Omnitrophota bacterium]